ncbi:MAG: hypothetical protein U9O53_03645 [archaeon]|nr:hypothetical protein [archaeon]
MDYDNIKKRLDEKFTEITYFCPDNDPICKGIIEQISEYYEFPAVGNRRIEELITFNNDINFDIDFVYDELKNNNIESLLNNLDLENIKYLGDYKGFGLNLLNIISINNV